MYPLAVIESQFSRTALLVAAYRARHTEQGLCDDPWARRLASQDGAKVAAEMDAVAPHLGLWIGVRTAYLDSAVNAHLSEMRQVVILGAGLDTRAARLATPGVRFFEVDAPASQAEKRARLATLEAYPSEAATYVPCDFETQDFVAQLTAHGFDVEVPALVVWEGVSYYLSEPAVLSTLDRLGKLAKGSRVLFDHVGKRFIAGQTRSQEDAATKTRLHKMGEPMIWGSDHVLPLLVAAGFDDVRIDTFDEACLRYEGTYDRERRFRFQFLVEARVG